MVGCDDQPGAGDGQTGREGMAERPVVSDEAGVMLVEGRGLGSRQTLKVERERRLGNLATPSNLQKLQTALHAKAKAEPEFRFYALYDKIYREDILAYAYACCRANKGAAGVDGQSFKEVEAYGVGKWLGELAQALREESYRPEAVRRVLIPKPNGKFRPLVISCLRERVCQTAVMLILEPIFEADLPPEQYAYRKGRNALDAAVLGYMNIAALRQHIMPTERIHGIFLKGGEKPNIVPREAEMDWYVRSNTIETLKPLKERVAGCLHGGAHAAGCHVELEWQPNPFADIVDNIPLLAAYVENSAKFGRMLTTEYMAGTGGGSTDMGNISYLTPSIHPMIAVAPHGVSLHTPEFADFATNDDATRAILDGAKIMAMTAIDLWTNDALVAEMREAFGDGFVPEGVL